MTTFQNRPHTALLVIDVQNGVVSDAYERESVVANIGTVVEKARSAEVPVVCVQHSSDNLEQGSEPWGAPPPELVIAHTNRYSGNHEAPGRTAGTVEAKHVDFAAS